ncbi:DUF3761 domain-containing protein [Burkholderia oklahomensis]|uniref:DUF3761 domain-containing protein n=1 Tax=Burkholderia oklahomensis TaxID=342113 RepID=A0AAI8BBL4_9BURK|nr:DUF3761 domain-containing protein [Burkholderia oklahomensis]AIO69828.1 hypothetical protein DM82_5552 [Burkholderia oklahomensis]AJX34102.1 hypothetical protein BG90_5059 [Burkholderia oklahomensis C6786]AOI39056.1 hypothetical protein WG70_05110 [Burkholderia oklahomensis EO147]AOI48743.1 hypothetical protein WI23_23230 [Burkholderia oklahomensis C6786]KUY58650.1 hypothetical protein WI23_17295 [Burkholderia oklahomensis C6786]
MKKTAILTALAAGLCISISSFAQAPASAPAGTTGLCKDGTFYSGASKKGACSSHKGLKSWYGASKAVAASGTPMAAAPVAAASGAVAASGATAAKSSAPAGAPGQVWVNTGTKVYHCPSDKRYGKTKQGAYMSESEAKAKGFRPSHGKTCS